MMIDPLLPPETQDFLESVHAFCEKRLRPHYQEHDRAGELRPDVLDAVAEMGLLWLRAPVEYGGQGADAVTTGLVCEAVGRADFNLGYLLNNSALVTDVLVRNGDVHQRQAFIPPIAGGEVIPALLLTEPEHGSDAAAIEVAAVPSGDDWVITGEKTSITFGMQARTGLLFARTSPNRAKGITAFYVDLTADGVTRAPFADLGGRAIGRASIHLDGVRVPADRVIGAVDAGFTQVMQGFEFARALIGLICLGAAGASIEEATQQARDRVAFGRPIGCNQGVAFPLVEHATHILAARLLCLRALELKDRGLPHAVESNMAKWWAPQLSVAAAHDALLLFGHAGYTEDYPLGQRLRDIIGLELGDGTAQITKTVVARHLLGREFAP
jgi:cyclohexanecarboxyl-CoA dehydrogenase